MAEHPYNSQETRLARFRLKRVVKRTIIAVVIVIVLVLAGGYAFFYNISRSPLPQLDGELNVAGLTDRVEVIRDANGIPNIYATNMHDLYFAQGYIMAQDRWWQMEFFRYTCAGRIEELTGYQPDTLAADILLRTMGWRQVAEQEMKDCDTDTLNVLNAFADGVNAYIMNRTPSHLALEYSVLGLTGIRPNVEPWSPVDTMAFTKLMAYDLGCRYSTEEPRSNLYGIVGKEMTDEWLTPPWPYDEKPSILEAEDLPAAKVGTTSSTAGAGTASASVGMQSYPEESLDLSLLSSGSSAGVGSNNWVATGTMTQSGRPLLANDPHLGIQMPSIWYEIGLHCPDDGSGAPLNVTGFGFACSPGVIIGHNDNITWGVTNLFPDVHDLYQIKVNPDDPLQYEWNRQWRDMILRQETISFGGGKPPVTVKIRQTHLGPIVNDNQVDNVTGTISGFNNEDPLALHWTALDSDNTARAVLGLNRARNWQDFRSALKYWDVPSQNFVYGDTQGNIGYQMPGRIPIRAENHSGLVPVPGWTDEFQWKGFVPYELLPSIYNPPRDYIVTANQAVVPPEYYDYLARELGQGRNYVFGHEWNYGYRAQRIVQLLKDNAPNTIGTYQAIQGDVKLLSAEEIMPYLSNLKFDNAELTGARDWLMKWDGEFTADSPQAALYAQFWGRLVNNTYMDQLPEEELSTILQPYGGNREMWSIFLLMQKPDDLWWDDAATKGLVEKRDDILAMSFSEGYAKTVADLGKNRNRWKWGNLHNATFVSNPLGASGIGLIESVVNRGPVAVGGSSETPNNTFWIVSKGSFNTFAIPSMRMIVDASDFSKSVCINSTGQSGHPASPNYGNMIDPWRSMQYHTMLWTREQVQTAAVHKLILNPAR